MIPVDDDIVENKEYFFIRIFNVEGAILSNSGEDYGTYQLFIYDNDKEDDKPETHDTTVVSKIIDNGDKKDTIGYEDVAFAITKFPAYKYVRFETTEVDGEVTKIIVAEEILKDYKVVIVDLPKGILTYNGKAVNAGDIIPSEDLAKGLLTYKGLPNEFGDSAKSFAYDTLTFQIVNDASLASETKKMYISMLPVNDKPEVTTKSMTVVESVPVGSVVGNVDAQDSVDMNRDSKATLTYKFTSVNDLKANEKDITTAFEIDAKTGVVKTTKALDYYQDSIYRGKVIVTDNGVPGDRKNTLSDTVEFTLKLKKDSRKPETHDTTVVSMIIDNSGKKDTIGYEDVAFAITKFPAYEYVRFETTEVDGKITKIIVAEEILKDYKVVIVDLPKGVLTYNGKAVNAGDIIPSEDLAKGLLTYKGLPNEFGDSAKAFAYATLKFQIVNDAKLASETVSMNISLKPMNDKPEVTKTTLKVSDLSPVNSVVGGVSAQDEVDSKYDSHDKLTYEIIPAAKLEANEKNFSDAFEIDSKTGEIKVIKTLDYRKDSLYVGRVVVTDNGVPGDRDAARFLKDTADIFVRLTLGDSTPVSRDTIFISRIVVNGDKKDTIGYEDVTFAITKFPAYEYFRFDTTKVNGVITKIDSIPVNDLENYSVMVMKLPKGVLKYKGVDVKVGDTILSDDLKKGLLTYKSLPNEFGDSANSFMYDSLSFQILYENHVSVAKVVRIQMMPMNDKPEVTTKSLTVVDNMPVGSVAGKVTAQDTVDANRDPKATLTYKFVSVNDLKANEKDLTTAFEIDAKTGEVKITKSLNGYQNSVYRGKVIVTDNGVPGDRKNTLSDTADVYVKLTHVNLPPEFENNTFHVVEKSPEKTVVGNLVAHDLEDSDDKLVYALIETSNEFEVAANGKITVKKGADLDYETQKEYTLKVSVKDTEGATTNGIAKIYIDDLREPPTLNDTIIHIPENIPVGSKVGILISNNPDKDKVKFMLVTTSTKFKVNENGTITTIGEIDYEKEKSHKFKVVVIGDDGHTDTANVTIKVDNIIEIPEVKITRGSTSEMIWLYPDTIRTNQRKIDFEWTADDKRLRDTTGVFAHDGEYNFSLCYEDPTMDLPGCDTVVVIVNNSIPRVNITKDKESRTEISDVTIEEVLNKKDTNIYVNHEENEVVIEIKDDISKIDTNFKTNLHLEPLSDIKPSIEKAKKLAKTKITLEDAENARIKRSAVNDDIYEITFQKRIGDDTVTVSYRTDKDGNAIRNSNEDVIMKVSFDKEIDGKIVKVSYDVNGENGEVVEKDNGGLYEFCYSNVDKFGGIVGVRYTVDENGKFVKTKAGDLGYNVTYTYKNSFGNEAKKDLFVIVDKVVPVVKILSPESKRVFRTSGVDVKWTVDGVVQDTLVIQGLKNGLNKIIRTYRDKAGNEGSDTVEVFLKAAKELDIHIEKPVTIVREDSVHKYYDDNPPANGQSYAVSVYNPYTEKEIETIIGGTFGRKAGSKKETYSGMDGHLGPTLLIDAMAPRCGNKTAGGLCTMDDVIERDGLISLDAGGGRDRRKVSVDEYVEKYCSDGFRKEYKNDPKKANLYRTSLHVTIWFYTNIGEYLDHYSFTQDIDDPDYVNEVGEVKMAFELKPDFDGYVVSEKGRKLGTGAYILSTEVKSVSELRCKLPDEEIGHKRYLTDELKRNFGYKRPNLGKKK